MPVKTADRLVRKPKLRAGLVSSIAALVLGTALGVPCVADAQYYGRWGGEYGPYGYYREDPYGPGPYGYEDDGPEPGYRGPGPVNDRPHPASPSAHAPASKESEVIPLEALLRRIKAAGYKLIATPRHNGNIYLAEVEDSNSIRHRLVYDAHDGHLIENTALGPVKKLSLPAEESTAPKTVEPTHAGDVDAKQNETSGQAKSDTSDLPSKEPKPAKAALPTQETTPPLPPKHPTDVR